MTIPPPMRHAHPYHMHEAILGQPDAISRMLAEERHSIGALADIARNVEQIHIVASGLHGMRRWWENTFSLLSATERTPELGIPSNFAPIRPL